MSALIENLLSSYFVYCHHLANLVGVELHLLQNPRNVLGHVGVDTREMGMGALYPPADDTADKPAVLILFIAAQQGAARVTLQIQIIQTSARFQKTFSSITFDRYIRGQVEEFVNKRFII